MRPDRHDGCAALQGQEGHAGAPLVEAAVERSGAFGVQGDGVAGDQQLTLLVERVQRGLTGARAAPARRRSR